MIVRLFQFIFDFGYNLVAAGDQTTVSQVSQTSPPDPGLPSTVKRLSQGFVFYLH